MGKMKCNFKRKMFTTEDEIKAELNREWDKKEQQVHEELKEDIVAQLMATCCMALNKEFGFGKDRLNKFKRSVEGLFLLMQTDGILGREFTTENCIEAMKTAFEIDFKSKGKGE